MAVGVVAMATLVACSWPVMNIRMVVVIALAVVEAIVVAMVAAMAAAMAETVVASVVAMAMALAMSTAMPTSISMCMLVVIVGNMVVAIVMAMVVAMVMAMVVAMAVAMVQKARCTLKRAMQPSTFVPNVPRACRFARVVLEGHRAFNGPGRQPDTTRQAHDMYEPWPPHCSTDAAASASPGPWGAMGAGTARPTEAIGSASAPNSNNSPQEPTASACKLGVISAVSAPPPPPPPPPTKGRKRGETAPRTLV